MHPPAVVVFYLLYVYNTIHFTRGFNIRTDGHTDPCV